MLNNYIPTSYVFSPGSGLRIRRLGVRLLLGVFCFALYSPRNCLSLSTVCIVRFAALNARWGNQRAHNPPFLRCPDCLRFSMIVSLFHSFALTDVCMILLSNHKRTLPANMDSYCPFMSRHKILALHNK